MRQFNLCLSFLLLSGLAACDVQDDDDNDPTVCTEIGCGSSFGVDFELDGKSTSWPQGEYRVEIAVDLPQAKTHSCTLSLPLDCAAGSGCESDVPFMVIQSGCAGDPDQQLLAGIEFTETSDLQALPTTVQVEVFFEGDSVGAGSYAPKYETSYPNGQVCGPSCEQATTESLTLAL